VEYSEITVTLILPLERKNTTAASIKFGEKLKKPKKLILS
jgi:hypothetical protein